MTDNEAILRREIRAAAAGRIPDQHIDEVVDLAIHAVDSAFAAVNDVVLRCSIAPVGLCATSIAISVIIAEARAKLDRIVDIAGAAGMKVETVTAGGSHV